MLRTFTSNNSLFVPPDHAIRGTVPPEAIVLRQNSSNGHSRRSRRLGFYCDDQGIIASMAIEAEISDPLPPRPENPEPANDDFPLGALIGLVRMMRG